MRNPSTSFYLGIDVLGSNYGSFIEAMKSQTPYVFIKEIIQKQAFLLKLG
jgi:hypothetical protein